MNSQSNPQLGQLVKIRKGRNADQAAVIGAVEVLVNMQPA